MASYNQQELRYLNRKHLDQEAKIIGNYYRDILKSYGVDCTYHKLDMSEFSEYKKIVDQNTIIKQAYGYDIDPDYNISAHMLTYMEVEQDIFQLNKFGLNPEADVNFYFDSTDFACALATKVGIYKEYPINEKKVICEVPDFNSQTSASMWPYDIAKGYHETYECGMLTGFYSAVLSGYEIKSNSNSTEEATIECLPYENTKFNVSFPSNSDLYLSLKHSIESDEFLETKLFLTYKITRMPVAERQYKNILRGTLHGSILFFDVNQIGKYIEKIHPMVGDIVTIDFPDDTSREQYKITDCFDKQLTNDSISPLLHKYIWKCKARRYVDNNAQGLEENEANERLEEKIKFDENVKEQVSDKISYYPDDEDDAYGGYGTDKNDMYRDDKGINMSYDKEEVKVSNTEQIELDHAMKYYEIMRFGVGSKLLTDGYSLIFQTADDTCYEIAQGDSPEQQQTFDSGIRWLKATDSSIVFNNIADQTFILAGDIRDLSQLPTCLNDLVQTTNDVGQVNSEIQNAYKFKESKTYLYSTPQHLYAKLQKAVDYEQLDKPSNIVQLV